ncbi:MAG: hypothetical protein FWG29_08995 [Treponema sp.]|nr:hypothetical protein [Treponema sp.]
MNNTIFKRLFFFQTLLMLCTVSFAQSIKVIGIVPKTDTGKLYQLQIGAYRLAANVSKASGILTRNGFVPQCEKKGDLVRVFVLVKAAEVRHAVDRLGNAGFKEVVIREYTGKGNDVKPVEAEPEPEPAKIEPEESKEPLILPPAEEDMEEEEEVPESESESDDIEEFEDYKEYFFAPLLKMPVAEIKRPEYYFMHNGD